ncbi:MAG: hypothetical protein K2X69_01575 [Silvanigrellaceae bacterium]|nr:hypothetical protein [Silvanigrellaceae bacterium]
MIFNDTIYHICKNDYSSEKSSVTLEFTRVFHSIRNNNELNFFDSNNLISFFSEDVKGFLESLHPMVSSRMLKDFLETKNSKESFEEEIRSMSTFEKYHRKLKYKKRAEVQSKAH